MDIVNNVREIVKPQYNTLECWVHSWPHIERVSANAETLARMENLTPDYCSLSVVSALCHDLGRIEEEKRKKRGDTPIHHALLSIEPTTQVLQQVGIKGLPFDEIVEAVAVHSYRVYEGKNNVVKILQDADKMNGFGPYGILGGIKYFGGFDYVDSKEIVKNKDNRGLLIALCDLSLRQLKGDVLEKVKKGVDFTIEWFDMLHTKSARLLVKEEYEYMVDTRRMLEHLI